MGIPTTSFIPFQGERSVVRSTDVDRLTRPPQFHSFPLWIDDYLPLKHFLFELQYEIEYLLRNLCYLGPLRAHPNRTYAWSGAQPHDVGPAGELVIDALVAAKERGNSAQPHSDWQYAALEFNVVSWLRKLGLVYDFSVVPLAEGRRLYEVKVRKAPGSAEVLLGDVGFGVSQILPVLVMAFYVPQGSILLLDQPDIHLHPSVQAGLADVFIDAWKNQGVQILFESHSEHLLRRLQRRIAEESIDQEDVALYFCSSDDTGVSVLSHLQVDQFGRIANWPEDFFGDQFGEIAAMSTSTLRRQGSKDI